MNHINCKPFFLPLLLIIASSLNAQQSPVAAGGVAKGTTGTVSFSIGQLVDETFSGGNNSITPGLQQPYEVFNPLPLKLLSFTATLQGNHTLLGWQTADEQNTNHFEVESKVADNSEFNLLSSVAAKGNGIDNEIYQYIDHNPSAGVTYYRLKEVDNDASESFSQIVLVNLPPSNTASIKVFPNPVVTQMNITFTATESKTYQLELVDETGRIVIGKQVACQKGANSIVWNVAKLTAGEYSLKAVGTALSPIKIIK